MAHVHGLDESHLDVARRAVDDFFASADALTAVQLAALTREQRRSRSRLSTDPDFLRAVCDGSWGVDHVEAARDIRARARASAARLVPWPRRAALATALEERALVVLSGADPARPFNDELCQRLVRPWERALGSVVPQARSASH